MKPKVLLFNAVSLDARIDWFVPDIGLFYRLASRWNEDATLAGCDTLLTVQEPIPAEVEADLAPVPERPGDERPILVVPDTRGRLRTWHYWKRQPYWRDCVVLCAEATPPEYLGYLRRRHIKSLTVGKEQVDFSRALEELHSVFGVQRLRVDSGGTLNGILLRSGLVDEVHVLVHPALVGGITPKSIFRADDLSSPDGVISLRLKSVEQQVNDILLISYEVVQ